MSKPRKNRGVKSYVGVPVADISKYYGPNAIVYVSRVQLEALGQVVKEASKSVLPNAPERQVVSQEEPKFDESQIKLTVFEN